MPDYHIDIPLGRKCDSLALPLPVGSAAERFEEYFCFYRPNKRCPLSPDRRGTASPGSHWSVALSIPLAITAMDGANCSCPSICGIDIPISIVWPVETENEKKSTSPGRSRVEYRAVDISESLTTSVAAAVESESPKKGWCAIAELAANTATRSASVRTKVRGEELLFNSDSAFFQESIWPDRDFAWLSPISHQRQP